MRFPRLLRPFRFALVNAVLLVALPASGMDSWNPVGKPSGWQSGGSIANPLVYGIVASGPDLFVNAYDKILRSRDSGETWKELDTRFDSNRVTDLLAWQGMVYAATPRGIYRTLDSGDTWSKSELGLQSKSIGNLTSGGGNLFATADSMAWGSTDSGRTWRPFEIDADVTLRGMYLVDGVFYAATTQDFYRSPDGGFTWRLTASPGKSRSPLSYVSFGHNVFATTLGSLVVSSDKGGSWSEVELDQNNSPWPLSLQSAGTVLYAGTYGNGIYRSDAEGRIWSFSGLSGGKVSAMAILGNRLFAAGESDWLYWTRLPIGASVRPRAASGFSGPRVHREASGAWLLDLEMNRPADVRVTEWGLAGQRRAPLWSGHLEAGPHRLSLGALDRRHGPALIQVRLQDGTTYSVPPVVVP